MRLCTPPFPHTPKNWNNKEVNEWWKNYRNSPIGRELEDMFWTTNCHTIDAAGVSTAFITVTDSCWLHKSTPPAHTQFISWWWKLRFPPRYSLCQRVPSLCSSLTHLTSSNTIWWCNSSRFLNFSFFRPHTIEIANYIVFLAIMDCRLKPHNGMYACIFCQKIT